jgi:fructokinase
MGKIICIGELLIDFICKDIDSDLIKGENFIKKAGGAPANVAAAISKLGGHAYFAGKVGDDSFGHFLKKTLEKIEVDTSMLILDKNFKTTLAFVSIQKNGERDFIFNRGADEIYKYEELDEEKLKEADIIHFGSATALLGGPLKDTYYKAVKLAKEQNTFVSFDPNYRTDLWKNRIDDFIQISREFISKADFVKVSHEELALISGTDDKDKAIDEFHELGAKIVTVTLGKEGALVSTKSNRTVVGSIKVKAVDSTGAGDAFTGAVLYKLAEIEEKQKLKENFELLKEIISFGNKVGAFVCTKMGAMEALDEAAQKLFF